MGTVLTKKQKELKQKKKDLAELWDASFLMCKQMIQEVRDGEKKLSASVIKELISFLKVADEHIKQLDQAEAERQRQKDLLKYGILPSEDNGKTEAAPDPRDPLQNKLEVPFPISEEKLSEPMK